MESLTPRLPCEHHHPRFFCIVAALLVLSGCATYKPLPLPKLTDSPHRVADLQGGQDMPATLRMGDVENLILQNNPDLRLARSEYQIAQAQLQQASLLPNPSLSASVGYLFSGPGDATAWSASISEDMRSLITLSARRHAAKAQAGQVNASLLWQEWQILAQARLLVVDIIEGDKLLANLRQTQILLDTRWQRVQKSVQAGQGEMMSGTQYFAAAAEARTSLNDLERLQLSRRHDLAALMGLAPDASIVLDENLSMPPVDAGDVNALTDDIARRRPDLVALQLGYEAQDAQLRAQIRAQFPAISLGYATASDNSRAYNGGPAITLELPLFDRNQANIKIASASRQQLHDDYENRLHATRNDIAALLAENAQARAQQAQIQTQLPLTDRLAVNAQAALDAGNIDMRSYVDLIVSAQSRHAALITLEQTQMEQQIVLATLVGAGLPSALPKEVTSP